MSDAFVIIRYPDNITSSYNTSDPQTAESGISRVIDYVINCFLIHIVASIGVVGNIFTIVVLVKHGVKDSTNTLIFSMACMDLLHSLTSPVRRCTCIVSTFSPSTAVTMAAFERVYLASGSRIVGIISASHIVLISLERTVAVYLPFKVGTIFSPMRTRIYLLIVYVFWLANGAPYLFLFRFAWTYDPRLGQTVGAAYFSQFYLDNYDSINQLSSLFISNIRGALFVVVVLVCSLLIGSRLHTASIARASISSSKPGADLKVVRMLLVVSLVYLGIGIPVHMVYMYFYFNPQAISSGARLSVVYNVLAGYVTDLFYTVNAAVNFIIYVTMSRKFRSTCKALLGCS